MQPPPACPHCGQLDQVRTLAAIYAAGTRWTEGPAGSSITQTHLAARLAPPPRPATPSCLTSCLRLIACGLTILSGGLLLLNLVVGRPLAVLLPLIIVCGAVVGTSWSLVWLARRWALRRAAPQLARWEAARRAWEGRYYCARCDDTFTPGQFVGTVAHTGATVRLPPPS